MSSGQYHSLKPHVGLTVNNLITRQLFISRARGQPAYFLVISFQESVPQRDEQTGIILGQIRGSFVKKEDKQTKTEEVFFTLIL